MPGFSSTSAIRQPQVGRSTCEAACTLNGNCYAYQISSIDNSCWFQFDNNRVNEAFSNPSITEYVKKYRCGSNVTATSISPTTGTINDYFLNLFEKKHPNVNPFKKIIKNLFLSAPTQCDPTFVAGRANSASIGAERQSITSQPLCEASCLVTANCYAYQIEITTTGIACWFQKNPASLPNQYDRTNVTEYTKICRSNATTVIATTTR